ncbi:calcium-activated potassium channel subunit beta-4-like [Corticium candelabrum]|uniref:calcium-activated potassium channel subunit beta-4-like n=1 Tax=Corticium candelabrum TaxID=121492 RepID=UPI002E2530D7|nr:calcium-activated potassium channel subunit beta-4-like [Corticium candelabrum]
MGADGCRAASLYLGGFLVFAMIITSPIVGVFVVKPGLRAERFRSANCTNVGYNRMGDESCSCGDECSSQFPCFKVYVNYEDHHNRIFRRGAVAYENEQTLIHYSDCTFDLNSCDHSYSSNTNKIESKLRSDGQPGRRYKCYYDPHDHNDVIMARKFSLAATINALFWPNFLFLLGVVLLVGGFCCKHGADECCEKFVTFLSCLFCCFLWSALFECLSNCKRSSPTESHIASHTRSEPVVTHVQNHSSTELTDEEVLAMELSHSNPRESQTGGHEGGPFDAPPSYEDALKF